MRVSGELKVRMEENQKVNLRKVNPNTPNSLKVRSEQK